MLGPSGCGKTTLLNIISGLLTPTRGRVLYDGEDVTDLPPEKRNIAQVFQFPVLYDTMTVFDNLAFPLRNRSHASGEVDRRVREVALADPFVLLERLAIICSLLPVRGLTRNGFPVYPRSLRSVKREKY